jgi:hypothetical protein
MQQEEQPLAYGDLRVRTDRRRGACLFWVVPDVAPGFNVPDFYSAFVEERRREVQELQQRSSAAAGRTQTHDR